MLSPSGWWLVVAAADLRYGVDRLLTQVRERLGHDPREGGAYVFRNRAGTRLKVLCVDAQGVWLSTRRLHEGTFHWPRADEAVWSLTPEQFAWLSAGVNWQRLSRDIGSLPTAV